MGNDESIPGPERQNRAASDDVVGAEAYSLRLEAAARRSEHHRRERLLDVLSSGRIILAWVLIGAAIFFIGIMGWHYFAPAQWGWLNETQLNRAESALAGGAVSLLILFLRRYM